MKNKIEVKYTVGEGDDAEEKTIIVRKPTAKDLRQSKMVYSKMFNEARRNQL